MVGIRVEAAHTRQSSRIPEAGHRRTPWRLRCRHGEDRRMGAGKPGPERPRNDRRFPPVGVKDVASYGWPPYKVGVAHVGGSPSGARFDHHNASLSEGAPPRCCGRGLAWKALLDAGWHGFPASAATTVAGRRLACPRVARCAAPGGGGSGESDPRFLAAGAPRGRGKGDRGNDTLSPSRGGSLSPQRSPAGRPTDQ